MRHEVTTTVDAPADLVWRTVRDVEKWPEWTPTMTEVRRLDGDPGGDLRVGSRAAVRQPGQPVRTWTVTELTEGRSFTWTSTGRGLRLSADHVVTTDGGTTVIELRFSVTGPLAPLAALAGRAVRAAVDTEAASLKAWCERTRR
jgi:uncharacterized membrane protein